MTERAFARALGHLYKAALDPQAWVSFLDEFSRLIGARGARKKQSLPQTYLDIF